MSLHGVLSLTNSPHILRATQGVSVAQHTLFFARSSYRTHLCKRRRPYINGSMLGRKFGLLLLLPLAAGGCFERTETRAVRNTQAQLSASPKPSPSPTRSPSPSTSPTPSPSPGSAYGLPEVRTIAQRHRLISPPTPRRAHDLSQSQVLQDFKSDSLFSSMKPPVPHGDPPLRVTVTAFKSGQAIESLSQIIFRFSNGLTAPSMQTHKALMI
jgi:hypothetical protein